MAAGGGTEVTTRRYNVGTLVMDVVDREKRQVVFQGGIEGVVTKEMQENREASHHTPRWRTSSRSTRSWPASRRRCRCRTKK